MAHGKNDNYYQYARPNDKLFSLKRFILRAKREIRGLKIYLPPIFRLAAEMSNNFA